MYGYVILYYKAFKNRCNVSACNYDESGMLRNYCRGKIACFLSAKAPKALETFIQADCDHCKSF